MKKYKFIVLAALLMGFFNNLFAQNSVKSLEECIQLALDNNLTLQSGKISVERAKDLQGTAFNISKTTLSIVQDPTSGGSPDNSLSISQSFDFPTVYTTRHSLLKAETNLEQKYFELSKNELVKEVTSAYYQLLYANQVVNIFLEQDSIYSKFLFLATTKLKSGESNRLEQMNAERLYNENKIELQKAEKNVENIRLVLQQWMNTDQIIKPKENNLSTVLPTFQYAEFNAVQSPIAMIYEGKQEVSAKNATLQKNQFLPSFDFSLRNQLLISGFNPYDINRERFTGGNFMGFEVGMSIPLFFGEQRANIRAANKHIEIAQIQYQSTIQSLQKEFESYLNEYSNAKKNLDYYINTGNNQAEEMKRISQLSYEKGEIGYVEYIQNLKTVVEIHLQYRNVINKYNQTIINLNYLQGNKQKQ